VKTSAVVLSLSLAANLALAAVLILRPTAPTSVALNPPSAADAATAGQSAEALRAALASGNAAALEAAGLSPDLARQLALGRALSRYAAALHASHPPADDRWWRKGTNRLSKEQRDELAQARRALSTALVAEFGEDPLPGSPGDMQYAYLPAAKREALRQILSDYEDMMDKYGPHDGVQLASDREKLKLLTAERDRDIAALLSPGELADYDLRTSPSAATIRNRYGDAIASEDDFRQLVALQKDFDDQNPPLTGRVTSDQIRARADAQRQLDTAMQAALGDDKYAALRRAADNDYRTLDALTSRLNLPATTSDAVVSARDSYAAESQKINGDASLTPAQRRSEIQDLGNRARTDVAKTLGTEGADAYAQRSPWLNLLQGGMAFSTVPTPGSPGALALGGTTPSVFPVLPPGVNAGGMRQMIVNTTSSNDGGSADASRDNPHVMTYVTSGSGEIATPPPPPPKQ